MKLTIFTHSACLAHDMGAGNPEQPARLTAVLEVLERAPFSELSRAAAPRAGMDQLTRVHPRNYVDRIFELAPGEGLVALDWDTAIGPATLEAALRAAGAACAAVDQVLQARGERAFCAVRPPGHHAEPERAMGFCFFNNVAVGAWHALEQHALKRVAIVDFDVHHGNGTQAMCVDEPRVLFCSSHQSPLYPGSGERLKAENNILNRPLPPETKSDAFKRTWREDLLPALDAFAPELLFVSAGFDGHRLDPLAQMQLEAEDFAWLTSELVNVANQHCDGRMVSTLEGGYHLDALQECVAAHLRGLMDR